jgi:hypothetical protein
LPPVHHVGSATITIKPEIKLGKAHPGRTSICAFSIGTNLLLKENKSCVTSLVI